MWWCDRCGPRRIGLVAQWSRANQPNRFAGGAGQAARRGATDGYHFAVPGGLAVFVQVGRKEGGQGMGAGWRAVSSRRRAPACGEAILVRGCCRRFADLGAQLSFLLCVV